VVIEHVQPEIDGGYFPFDEAIRKIDAALKED
jgi:hypothetical protein